MESGLAENTQGVYGGMSQMPSPATIITTVVITLVILAATWKLYQKAGQPGWAAIIPIYDTYIMFKLAWGSGWMFLLLFIPIVDVVVYLMLLWKLAKAFGKGVGMFLMLLLIHPVGLMILGFGSAAYIGTDEGR